MVVLISSSSNSFKNPQQVKILNKVFNNVNAIQSKEFIDADSIKKTISDISSQDADYTCIANEKTIEYTSKSYKQPVTRIIDGKKYDNIYQNIIDANGNKTYTRITSFFGRHEDITVNKNGEFLNNKIKTSNKVLKTINNLYKSIKTIFK